MLSYRRETALQGVYSFRQKRVTDGQTDRQTDRENSHC